ncbi:MAG: hypothetical protein GY723_00155 [bacterium]|nr:hypothetical protein [bacterium]
MPAFVLPALFFASGFSALVYEVLWARQLVLVFGNTVDATTTVLATFMGGLALGGVAGGRIAARLESPPLKVYAGLEAGIAVFALGFPMYLQALLPVYQWIYPTVATSPAAVTGMRFVMVSIYLALPAALMGATLPILVRATAPQEGQAAASLGGLYAANTAGGVLGVVLTGFLLIPSLGLSSTSMVAVAINLAVAAAGWSLASRSESRPAVASRTVTPTPERMAAQAAIFATGMFGLALEVIWTRILLLVFGSTVYAFSVMLATFLTGIALGATISRRFATRVHNPSSWIALVPLLLAIAAGVAAHMVDLLPTVFLATVVQWDLSWRGDILGRALVSAIVLLPTSLLLGAMFPLVIRVGPSEPGPLARWTGTIYAYNTAGAILGSVTAGFLLVPMLGTLNSLRALSAALGLLGLVLAWRTEFRVRATLVAVTIGILLASLHPWDVSTMFMRRGQLAQFSQATKVKRTIKYHAEGKISTVTVTEVPGVGMKLLRVDGKIEMTTKPIDVRLGKLLAHLPMLLHPNPENVFNLGLGAGLTVGALSTHGPSVIDVAELEPHMVEAARFFEKENQGVLDHDNLRILFQDGRNHLLMTRRSYDVLASDPLEPVVGPAASLFTREHFEVARSRLAPGGLMSQWIPLYELGPREFTSILKAFVGTFEHVTLFLTGGDAILIGSEEALDLDADRIEKRMEVPAVRDDLMSIGFHSVSRLLGSYVTEIGPEHTLAMDVLENTDDRPYLEFAAPKLQRVDTWSTNLRRLLTWKKSPPPGATQGVRDAFRSQKFWLQARMALKERDLKRSHQLLRRSLKLDPGNPLAQEQLREWEAMRAAAQRARR